MTVSTPSGTQMFNGLMRSRLHAGASREACTRLTCDHVALRGRGDTRSGGAVHRRPIQLHTERHAACTLRHAHPPPAHPSCTLVRGCGCRGGHASTEEVRCLQPPAARYGRTCDSLRRTQQPTRASKLRSRLLFPCREQAMGVKEARRIEATGAGWAGGARACDAHMVSGGQDVGSMDLLSTTKL